MAPSGNGVTLDLVAMMAMMAFFTSMVNSPRDPTLIELYGKCVQRHKGDCSFDVVDLVLLEEKLDAFRETFHGIILGLEHLWEVQFNAFN